MPGAFCAALLIAGEAAYAGVGPLEAPLWRATYEVRFKSSAAAERQAEIAARLAWIGDPANRPAEVRLSMADDGFPGGYGSHVEGMEMPADGITLPVDPSGRVEFRYTVRLTHDTEGWGPGPDEAPYAFDGGAFWTGRSLFITAPRSRPELSLTAEPGSRISVSYPPVPGFVGRYRVDDEDHLRNSFLMVGSQRESRLAVGEAEILLALAGPMGSSMEQVEPAIARFLNAAGALFHGAPPRRILVAGSVGARPGSLDGGTFGDDVSFLADEPLSEYNADRWRPFLCHEIFHLWNGNTLHFDRQAYWFTEGFTEYYAFQLPRRLGQISSDEFRRKVGDKAAAYLEAAGGKGLLAAGDEKFLNPAVVYDGGFLAALSLDLEIRAATKNRRSLDEVMRRLYRRARGGQALTLEDVRREVSRAAGVDLDAFFRDHIAGERVLPLEQTLGLSGIALEVRKTQLPVLEDLLGTLLRCPSARRTEAGIELLRCEPGDLSAGDILVEAAGSPVTGFQSLRSALCEATPGSVVPLTVLRGGQRDILKVRLGGDPGRSLPSSPHVEASLKPRPDAGKIPLEIRSAVFGP
ncbi:MAG TPA: hypothetical protein VFW45_07885 [Candidatus Polarisedimenticolia bacterium]|nr:hypothetical protein [Candidatus Polarisedimenticolia bacterium]